MLVASGGAAAAAALDVSLRLHFGLAALAIVLVSAAVLRYLAAADEVPHVRAHAARRRGYLPPRPVLLRRDHRLLLVPRRGSGDRLERRLRRRDPGCEPRDGGPRLRRLRGRNHGLPLLHGPDRRPARARRRRQVGRSSRRCGACSRSCRARRRRRRSRDSRFSERGSHPSFRPSSARPATCASARVRSALAAVVTISYLGSIIGPALIGLVTSFVGLRAALSDSSAARARRRCARCAGCFRAGRAA